MMRAGFSQRSATRNYTPIVKPSGYKKPVRMRIEFDSNGRYLLMHQNGALWYYRVNALFIISFFSYSFYMYKANTQVFFGQAWLGKLYVGSLALSIVGLWLFANKHINNIWLLKGGKEVSIETYTNFGLTYARPKTLQVHQFEGNRLFLTQKLNLF